MATDALTPEKKTGMAEGAAHPTHKSRAGVLALYILALIIIFASAIVLVAVLQPSPYFWPLTLLGAIIIAALVSAAAMPYLLEDQLTSNG